MKYFFFDIDGTLASGKPGNQHIPETTKYALKKLQDNGNFVAIATGRSYAMAKSFMEMFNIDNMVSDGGNGITINKQLISIEPLDYKLCIDLINECKEKNFPWGFSPDDSMHRIVPDETFYKATNDIYMPCIIKKDLDPSNYSEIFKVYVACSEGEETRLETLDKLPWYRYHNEYFIVEPMDKAKGIRKIMDYFNGDSRDVVVFGDSINDMSMFLKDEWTCIAMGNACDELKQKASYVTTDIDKDGIYNACVHYGWI